VTPSGRAARVVACLGPREIRDAFVGDLLEARARRRLRIGRLRAEVWYWRQLLTIAPLLAMRARAGRAAAQQQEREQRMTFESLLQDLRFSTRLLWRARASTMAIVATVALGIGANTAIFSILDALLLKPLPYPQSDHIVTLWQDLHARGGPVDEWATPGNLADWRAEKDVFASMASVRGFTAALTGEGDPEPVRGEAVTDGYFDVAGVAPAIGRAFTAAESMPNAPRVVILSYALWQRRFGGDRSVLGRRITIGGEPHEIVGVMPEHFRPAVLPIVEVWRPDRLNLANPARGAVVLRVVARLQPGVTMGQAANAMSTLARRLAAEHPDSNHDAGVTLISLQDRVVGNVRVGLLVLFGAVWLVLLLACVNIANLLLARASGRAREVALRSALGAGRRRLVRQLLTESLVLAGIGGGVGIVMGIWATHALVSLAPAGTPRLDEVTVDGRLLAFGVLLTIGVGVLCGLAPAFQLSRSRVVPALKEGDRGSSGGGQRARRTLIVTEVALALVLLVGAGLLLRTFVEMRRADLGFDPRNVLTGYVRPDPAKYPTEAHRQAFFNRLLEHIATVPGVRIAAVSSIVPLNAGDSDVDFLPEGLPVDPRGGSSTWYRLVSANYFEAIGITLRSGRPFQPNEAGNVAIVNQALADKYWPGQSPLGRRVRFSQDAQTPWFNIVGVVNDVKQTGARSAQRFQTFLPYWEVPELAGGLNLVLKTAVAPEQIVQPLRQAVRDVDPDVPVAAIETMDDLVSQSMDEPRSLASIVGLFACLAVIVAAVGVYGVIAYSVSERRREIGVRLALGATSGQVFGLVLRDGVRLAASGVAAGIGLSLLMAPNLGHVLFGVGAIDPATFVYTSVGLLVVAIAATMIPAARAMRVSPVAALRGD